MPPTSIAIPIAVLGSGVSALTTALALLKRPNPPAVTIYYDPASEFGDSPRPASRVAPAMFTPYAPADSPQFRRRTESSFRAFADLAAHDPIAGNFVRMGELREYIYNPEPASRAGPWLDALLQTRPLAAPPPVRRATTSIRPHINMDLYLQWLLVETRTAGATRISFRAPSFEAIFSRGHTTIINCTGLGARTLTRDPLLKPMHGQVLHVPNDIGLTYGLHDDAPNGLIAYVFNFGDHLILGGTFELNREGAETDEPSLAAIIDRCRTLLRLDGHPRWADLAKVRTQVRAALRPCRGPAEVHEQIRLEREDLPNNRAIIHNYGHGRTGVTLSWGCAHEAADLALNASL